MDLRHIRAFLAVADALSVTRAAERLHISQPPLTRHIHQLEHELGVTLFIRHRHGVTLTAAGQQLLEKARALDALAGEFYEEARRVAAADSSTIRVGIGWGLWDTVQKVRIEFAREYPNVTIAPSEAHCWADAGEQLRSRKIDVLFSRPPFDPAHEVSPPIYHERIQAVVSDASPLARQAMVTLRDVAREPLLLWDRHIAPALYDKILDLYAKQQLTTPMIPTPGAGPYNHAGLMLVASGKGVYLCYGVPTTGTKPPSGVAVRPLSDPEATIEVCVVHRKDESSPVVRRFVESVWRAFPREKRLRVSEVA
ncbi:MAG TPA: LysR family transcriptional regulator [Vicinamibacterales bacterium]|nr:LysR family transcriptional regulator [Vicinamibacterales bacterium]